MPSVSVFDIFKIGIGPSSSHTVGPMKAAHAFVDSLRDRAGDVSKIDVSLHGSLAWTGKGHATDTAIQLGLMGLRPDSVDPDEIPGYLRRVLDSRRIDVPGLGALPFDPASDIRFDRETVLPRHTNGMRFTATGRGGGIVRQDEYYSVGGGFIIRGDDGETAPPPAKLRHDFSTADSLLKAAAGEGVSIAELVAANERAMHGAAEVECRLDGLWAAMRACIDRGLHNEGVLPGKIGVIRRAAKLRRRLEARDRAGPLDALDWVNAYAIAVNEENAAGGRVVTSPTNGAAGVIPAVLMYYERFVPGADEAGVRTFLLTAGAIGILYKINASISGAEMGCQGEVGVACSMAAGGLVAAQGGSNDQVEEAAEIGMEHNLGLTCDPVGGLVQIPCIERNAMGAVKAINAARLAMHGDGTHKVSLDNVIATMRQTGRDMSASYKETSTGGLAVNVPEC